MSQPPLIVRAAGATDRHTVGLLARRAGHSRVPRDKALLAERDGVPVAAIGLTSGAVLADRTSTMLDVVNALTFTRYRIMRQGGQAGAARSLLARGV